MNNQLIKAVSEQCGYETDDSAGFRLFDASNAELIQIFSDVMKNDVDGGHRGFLTYYDTCKFARDNMPLIIEQLKEDASNHGVDVFEMVSHLKYLNDYPAFEIASVIFNQADEATINDGADTQILNALAWYALEEVARYITDIRECA